MSVNVRTDRDMFILDIGFNTVDVIVVERGRIGSPMNLKTMSNRKEE